MENKNWLERHRSWFIPYLESMVEEMGLLEWTIKFDMSDPPELAGQDVHMAMKCHDHYHDATLYVHDQPFGVSQFRYLITHELVHLHLRGWMVAAYSVETQMGELAFGVQKDRLEHEMEMSVDDIAVHWAKTLPLPQIPERLMNDFTGEDGDYAT